MFGLVILVLAIFGALLFLADL